MDHDLLAAYLDRIGAARPARPDAAALRDLHLRHQRQVPFENLSIHRGEDIVLEETALVRKILGGRGGFCYELNGAFAGLLRALGYQVTLLAGRVTGEDGRLGPPYDHLALRVADADGSLWLADVGFGRHAYHPLDLTAGGEQSDPGGRFLIRGATGGRGDLEVLRDGAVQYVLEARPRDLADFEATCWWQRTSPHSHFRRSLVCSRLTRDGRVTLSGRTLVTTGAAGRTERELTGPAQVLAAYREHFGIALDREPAVLDG